ncbi:hypothetical protein [Actinomadura opuntiae]|uniref:hypothetical protein n=1 Tax=Actinomadura sp. OS1-43 TaxID=604315 RepID=UPI00255AF7C0|nr:hypothetical protein [Actinomadura sp. OS1-43]MDL4813641.1 hypothetical protein [Actinomadura sp. OS1-43]
MEETRTLPESVHMWSDHLAAEPPRADEMRRWMCRAGAPHHLAKCNREVYEFEVDVLDLPEVAEALPGAAPRRRPRYQAAEQQFAFMMTDLDGELSHAETGRLIRMVLHAQQGAMLGVAVTPHNYVVGIVFGAAAAAEEEPPRSLPSVPLVRDADRFTCELATALRGWLGLPSQNPGGWQPGQDQVRGAPPIVSAQRLEQVEEAAPRRREWSLPGEPPATWLGDALHPEELAYLAHGRDGQVVAEADMFESHWISAGRPPGEPADATRAYYRGLAERFELQARQLGQVARQAVRGRLLRIVLDVEQGAVYYYRFKRNEYLVGVTMNQSRVSQADERLGDLVAELLREDSRTE